MYVYFIFVYLFIFFFSWVHFKNCAWESVYCGRLVLLSKIFVHGPVGSLGGEPGNNFVCKSQRIVHAYPGQLAVVKCY